MIGIEDDPSIKGPTVGIAHLEEDPEVVLLAPQTLQGHGPMIGTGTVTIGDTICAT